MSKPKDQNPEPRRQRLSDLACADGPLLKRLWVAFCDTHEVPKATVLRGPEVGTVMVRGRAGAVGAAFNLGEMTVTRTSLRLPDGSVGHGYVQGRDREMAHIAALIDAMAEAGHGQALGNAVLEPLRRSRRTAAATRAAKAAATKVEFFTMVRGEA